MESKEQTNWNRLTFFQLEGNSGEMTKIPSNTDLKPSDAKIPAENAAIGSKITQFMLQNKQLGIVPRSRKMHCKISFKSHPEQRCEARKSN